VALKQLINFVEKRALEHPIRKALEVADAAQVCLKMMQQLQGALATLASTVGQKPTTRFAE